MCILKKGKLGDIKQINFEIEWYDIFKYRFFNVNIIR